MFGLFKKKLKDVVDKFSKKAEEEAEIIEVSEEKPKEEPKLEAKTEEKLEEHKEVIQKKTEEEFNEERKRYEEEGIKFICSFKTTFNGVHYEKGDELPLDARNISA